MKVTFRAPDKCVAAFLHLGSISIEKADGPMQEDCTRVLHALGFIDCTNLEALKIAVARLEAEKEMERAAGLKPVISP